VPGETITISEVRRKESDIGGPRSVGVQMQFPANITTQDAVEALQGPAVAIAGAPYKVCGGPSLSFCLGATLK